MLSRWPQQALLPGEVQSGWCRRSRRCTSRRSPPRGRLVKAKMEPGLEARGRAGSVRQRAVSAAASSVAPSPAYSAEPVVAALLVGQDEPLHGDRVGGVAAARTRGPSPSRERV